MKKKGIGIIGFGRRGVSLAVPLLEHFSDRVEFIGFCDHNSKKTAAARNWTNSRCGAVYDNIEEFLQIPEMDLVMICVPQFAHAELACRAFAAGKDIFLEKPMARNIAECDSILAARDKAGKELFMGFNLRNHSVCLKIKELLSSGIVGKPQTIVCTDFYSGGMTYFRRWHRLKKNSGGLIVEKGCHSLDLLNWFMDSRPILVASLGGLDVYLPKSEAASNCRNCKLASQCQYFVDVFDKQHKVDEWGHDPDEFDLCIYNSPKDTFDNHMVLIEYANSCRATYIESFASRVTGKSGRQFIINGPQGQIWADLSINKITVYFNHALGEVKGQSCEYFFPEESGSHGGADIRQLHYIIDCLYGHRQNKLFGEIGREAVLVAQAAEKAACEKRLINISNGKLSHNA